MIPAHPAEHAPGGATSPRPARAGPVLAVFAALVLLTGAEVVVAGAPASPAAVRAALVGLVVAKAALVGFFFMHLRGETPALRWTVLGPLLAPGLYGLVLAADAAWRALP